MTRVLVLQVANRPGPWVCRSLRHAGYAVIGGDEADARISSNRLCRTPYRYPSPISDPDGFFDAIASICEAESVDIVLPNDDERVMRLLATRPLPAPTVAAVPTPQQIATLADKGALHQAAKSIGLPGTDWVQVSRLHDDIVWPGLPCVVKSGASEIPLLREKAVVVHTQHERTTAVERVLRRSETAVAEAFLRGTPWRVYFAVDEHRFAGLPSRTIATYPSWGGVARRATIDSHPKHDAVIAAERLVRLVGYRGIGNIQFIEVEGKLHLHDVNLRVPAAVALPMHAGFDLPRIAVEIARRNPDAVPAALTPVSQTYVWAEGEVRAALDDVDGSRARALMTAGCRIAAATVQRRTTVDPITLADPFVARAAATRAWRHIRRSGLTLENPVSS